MSSSEPLIYCPNPNCTTPLNPVSRSTCEGCQTPLIRRYLWATGGDADKIPAGEAIANRYYVLSPQVWLDTQPALPPYTPDILPGEVSPYLRLYPHRLHLPGAFGFCTRKANATGADILLLDNIPVDKQGKRYPTLRESWSQASAVRQVYWLWQLLQLWAPLSRLEVASSLLVPDNLRVEGWRVRLQELYADATETEMGVARFRESLSGPEASTDVEDTTVGFAAARSFLLPRRFAERPTLRSLAESWFQLALNAQPAIADSLQQVCEQMQTLDQLGGEEQRRKAPPETLETDDGLMPPAVVHQMNQLLLEQAAQQPLHLKIYGLSDTGPQRSHNEDTCYPTAPDLRKPVAAADPLLPRLAIVCDGIGGHEGGEVASQLAVQSIKLQMQALLTEMAQQSAPLAPNLIAEQIQAAIRVVNNLIANQNDAQGREARRRMGTTLVMALQLPQKLPIVGSAALENTHELYLAHVGDSRAYWITANYCHALTVDDDVSVREVRLGRSLYHETLKRPDAGALTQALGTRGSEFLHPNVQRLIVEEDGLLLLCSDGLSDNDWVEQSWTNYAAPVLQGLIPLEQAVQSLVNLANQKNGYDNTSVVLLHCRVSPQPLQMPTPVSKGEPITVPQPDLSEASRALLYDESLPPEDEITAAEPTSRKPKGLVMVLGIILASVLAGGLGVLAWAKLNPAGLQQLRDRLLPAPTLPTPSSGSSPNKPLKPER